MKHSLLQTMELQTSQLISGLQSQAQLHPEKGPIEELYRQVQMEAMRMTRKRAQEELTLIEMLNAFDLVVSRNGGSVTPSSDKSSGTSGNDISSQVYRLILKSEREKQFQSIQDLTEEIKSMKSEIEQPISRGSRNTAPVQNQLNAQYDQFEFMGSFGHDQLQQKLAESKTQRVQPNNRSQKRSTLPKISLDSVLGDLHKNESIVNRCQKLKDKKNRSASSKRGSQESKSRESSQKKRKVTSKVGYGTKQGSEKKKSSPFRSQNTNINYDLGEIFSPSIISQNAMTATNRGSANKENRQANSRFPKLNISNILEDSMVEGKSNNTTMDRAIDSNRNIAFAYYMRRLLLQGWRAFFNYRLEKANKRFYERISSQKMIKNIKRKTLRALQQHGKVHYGHAAKNTKAAQFGQSLLARKYMQLWLQALVESREEQDSTCRASQHLTRFRKDVLMRAWRSVTLELQLKEVQNKTAQHIYRQRYLRLALISLRLVVNVRTDLRRLNDLAKEHCAERLLRKSLTGFQINHFSSMKKREYNAIADKVYHLHLQKHGIKLLQAHQVIRTQEGKMYQYAFQYRLTRQTKKAFEVLKAHGLIQMEHKSREAMVDGVYYRRLKQGLMRFVRQSTKEFRNLEKDVYYHMHQRKMRELITRLSEYAKGKHIATLPKSLVYFYIVHYLFFQEHSPTTFTHPSLTVSPRPHYQSLHVLANTRLQQYMLQRIYQSWRAQTSRITAFKQSRTESLLTKIVRSLRSRVMLNGRYRYLLKQYQSRRLSEKVSQGYLAMKIYWRQRVQERRIVGRWRLIRDKRALAKGMVKWAVMYKRRAVKRGQKEVAEEISRKKRIEDAYTLWRHRFQIVSKKRMRNEMGQNYLQATYFRKYFSKFLSAFYSLRSLDLLLHQHLVKLRSRLLKKTLCALLANVLDENRRKYQESQAHFLYSQHLLSLAIRGWTALRPELKNQNALNKIIRKEHSLKLQLRSIQGLRMYVRYRREKSQTDSMMGRAVQMCTVKRLFSSWQRHLRTRVGLKMLENTLFEARVRSVFHRLRRKTEFDESVIRHMTLFNAYKLLEITFSGLKRKVERRDRWQVCTQFMAQRSLTLKKHQCLREWFEHWQQDVRERNLAHFSLISIKNVVMRKYFIVLKQRYEQKRSMRNMIYQRALSMKSRCLQTLSQYADRKVRCRHSFQVLSQQRRIESLQFYLQAWREEQDEIRGIGHLIGRQNLKVQSVAFDAWMTFLLKCRDENSLIANVQALQNQHSTRQSLSNLASFARRSILNKQKVAYMKNLSSQLTLKTYVKALRAYYRSNFVIIQKRLRISRKVKKRSLTQLWKNWHGQCEPRLTRVRVAGFLCSLSKRVNTRFALGKWLLFAQEGVRIQQLGENRYAVRVHQMRKLAVQRLRRYSEVRSVNRERRLSLEAYHRKKLQIRLLAVLLLSTRLLQRRRLNKSRALEYRRWHLYKRSLLGLAYQVQQAKTFRLLTIALHGQLRKSHAPKVFRGLKVNQLRGKEKKIKQQFADGFTVERVYQKIFKAIYWNMIVCKDIKAMRKRAIGYYRGNLTQKGFYGLKLYSQRKVISRTNRRVMTRCVQRVNYKNSIGTAFSALLSHKNQQRQRLGYIKLLLMLNEMQRVLNVLRDYKNMKRSLRARQGKYTHFRLRSYAKTILMVWMRALNIEMKTKLLQRQRVNNTRVAVLVAFQRYKDLQQIIRLNLTKRVVQYLSLGFKALQNNLLRNKKLRMVQGELTARYLVRTVQKTFMGLRYQCLVEKNLRLMQQRLKGSLIERSFDGWRYQNVLQKTKKQYETYRSKRDMSFFFTYWRHLQALKVNQRIALTYLLVKKDKELKGASLTVWKRGVFKETYLSLLKKHLLGPQQRSTAQRCLTQWHRYAKLQSRKDQITTYLTNLNASLTARKNLQNWYLAATQGDGGSKLKMRIMAKKLEAVLDSYSQRKAIWKIGVYGHREEYLSQNLNVLTQNKRDEAIHRYFGEWRHRFAVKQMNRVVREQSQRKLKGFCLTAFVAFTQMSKLQGVEQEKLVDYLRSVTSPEVYFMLFNGLTPSDETYLRPRSLASHYFYRLKASAAQSRLNREARYKAVQFNKYKLYVKHFYSFMNFTTDRLQKNSQRHRASVFYRYRTHMKVMRAFVVNTLKQRKYRNADSFYHAKICATAYQSLVNYHGSQKSKAHVNTKMMRVLKRKCIRIFQNSFSQWRVRYQERAYRRQAIVEFAAFRHQRQLKVVFNYFAAVCEQQKQIKDMTFRAQNYFQKRRNFKLMYSVLHALQDYGLRNKQSKESFVDNDLQAMRFYVYNLQSRHLRAWRREVQHHKKRNVRSKLYAIFSAWKFYIKERTLLKMYLKESNIMKDPSLMSTIELKENYARVSNPKSFFGESISSEGLSGTPFRSAAVDHQRAFTPMDVNQMQSPQFYNRGTNYDHDERAIKMHDDELMQATGQFSSVSSCQTPSLMEGTGTAAASTAKMIMQSSKTNTRYTRL